MIKPLSSMPSLPCLSFLITSIDRTDFLLRQLSYLDYSSNKFDVIIVLRTSEAQKVTEYIKRRSLGYRTLVLSWGKADDSLSDLYRRLLYGASYCATELIAWLPLDDFPVLQSYATALEQLYQYPDVDCAYGSMIDFVVSDSSNPHVLNQRLCGDQVSLTGKYFPSYDMSEPTGLERLLQYNSIRHNFALVYSVTRIDLFVKCISACARSGFDSWRWSDRLHCWGIISSSKVIKVPPTLLHQVDGCNTGGYQMIRKEPTDISWTKSGKFKELLDIFYSEVNSICDSRLSRSTFQALLSISVIKNTLLSEDANTELLELLTSQSKDGCLRGFQAELDAVGRDFVGDVFMFVAGKSFL